MEIAVACKFLPDQFGADHLAVFLDQAAIGLLRKDGLCKAGHTERINQPCDGSKGNDHDECWTKLFQHFLVP
ncbi:hypothetical protein D9M69_680080 [compost metagenome]